MDFFEQQDIARRRTFRLVVCFIMAVAAIIICLYLTIILIFVGFEWRFDSAQADSPWWRPELFFASTAGTLALVVLGTAYKTMSLASGGQVVAENLGGRPINRSTTNRDERVLLNVVDEMAIASGVPSPPVYLLEDEEGINAFAAGYEIDDAVIGMTKGCIGWLSRDELQGVVAHEFSHILNGDMRLNLRLMGLLHGILLIGLTGYWFMRSTRGGGARGRGAAIIVLGLALFLIGYIGVFFAKLIKAAVSRQREYLADASAIQFTRNPEGIAGALRKIGSVQSGARVTNSQAKQASHMFFGDALKQSFFGWFSTHPPLEDRIRRIDPAFEGTFPKPRRPDRSHEELIPLSRLQVDSTGTPTPASDQRWKKKVPFQPAEALRRVRSPLSDDIAWARTIESEIPSSLHELVNEAFGARAAIYGLLLDQRANIGRRQLARLKEHADAALLREVEKHQPSIGALPPEVRLPLVELAIPALRQLNSDQYRSFYENMNHLIRADRKIRLFEFLLRRVVQNHLEFRKKRRRPLRSAKQVVAASAKLLWALAHVGEDINRDADSAFKRSMQLVFATYTTKNSRSAPDLPDFAAVDDALERLSFSSTTVKKRVLQACAVCIEHDGLATVEEIQLVRVIAETLNCPMSASESA